MSVSYEERLSSLVLKEEFFPLMNDMKECIGTLSAAGKGIVVFFSCILKFVGQVTDFEKYPSGKLI